MEPKLPPTHLPTNGCHDASETNNVNETTQATPLSPRSPAEIPEPTSPLLRDILRETRAARLTSLARRLSIDSYLASQQSRTQQTELRRRPSESSIALSLAPRGMGIRESEAQVTQLTNLNFDLKLELYHRRLHNDALQTRLGKALEMKEELKEAQRINEGLLRELELRDTALDQAGRIIVSLEDGWEGLGGQKLGKGEGSGREKGMISMALGFDREKYEREERDEDICDGIAATNVTKTKEGLGMGKDTTGGRVGESAISLSVLSESSFPSVYGHKNRRPVHATVDDGIEARQYHPPTPPRRTTFAAPPIHGDSQDQDPITAFEANDDLASLPLRPSTPYFSDSANGDDEESVDGLAVNEPEPQSYRTVPVGGASKMTFRPIKGTTKAEFRGAQKERKEKAERARRDKVDKERKEWMEKERRNALMEREHSVFSPPPRAGGGKLGRKCTVSEGLLCGSDGCVEHDDARLGGEDDEDRNENTEVKPGLAGRIFRKVVPNSEVPNGMSASTTAKREMRKRRRFGICFGRRTKRASGGKVAGGMKKTKGKKIQKKKGRLFKVRIWFHWIGVKIRRLRYGRENVEDDEF